MKRLILIIVLALLCLIPFGSCGRQTQTAPAQPSTPQNTSAPEQTAAPSDAPVTTDALLSFTKKRRFGEDTH